MRQAVILAIVCLGATTRAAVLKPETPIRGWNSWTCFGTANETITLASAEGLVKSKLAASGYVYITLDEGWFGSSRVHDEYGRLIPDPSMYPTVGSDGTFKVLAERLHRMGLKLGVWYMAGIPKYAVAEKTKIKGTSFTAADIALTDQIYCPRWHADWGYAVDHSHPAAAAWYESLVELWASWGVDLVKVDCINAEDMTPNKLEDVMAISRAMEASSQDFVFSLSPGGFANVSQLAQMTPYTTMARVTDDFWDNWDLYMNQGGGDGWASGASHWDAARDMAVMSSGGFHIDLDLLPFGRVGQPGQKCSHSGPGCPRQSRFTLPEQQAIVTLWTLVRSPLIFGGDVTVLDTTTHDLVTNPSVLAMAADVNRSWEVLRVNTTNSGYLVWKGLGSDSDASICKGGAYIALFNIMNSKQSVSIRWTEIGVFQSPDSAFDIWSGKTVSLGAGAVWQETLPPHGVVVYCISNQNVGRIREKVALI